MPVVDKHLSILVPYQLFKTTSTPHIYSDSPGIHNFRIKNLIAYWAMTTEGLMDSGGAADAEILVALNTARDLHLGDVQISRQCIFVLLHQYSTELVLNE